MSENFTSLFLELCKKVAAMQDELNDLKSKNGAMQVKVDDLESKNGAMQDELDDLKDKVDILVNPPTHGEFHRNEYLCTFISYIIYNVRPP